MPGQSPVPKLSGEYIESSPVEKDLQIPVDEKLGMTDFAYWAASKEGWPVGQRREFGPTNLFL